ncbi:hypothetical protein ACEPAH_8082 [Sanghuangporus vaninii]
MPATRSPARSVVTPYHCQSMAKMSLKNSEAQSSSLSTSRAIKNDISVSVSPESSLNTEVSSKKRRSPNAFILYRSHIIAEKLYPPELTHQNDVSCFVARRWKTAPVSERNRFFRMADDEKRRLKDEAPSVEPSKTKSWNPRRPVLLMQSSLRWHFRSTSPQYLPRLRPSQPLALMLSLWLAADYVLDFPEASQPPYATSYNLPEWNQELDGHEHDTLQPGHALSHWPSSSSYPSSCSAPYQVDNSYFGALDAAMQAEMDFQLLVEGNTSFAEDFGPELTSLWAEPPPFDVYLPLMPPSYDQ